jgi:hypothetical protein
VNISDAVWVFQQEVALLQAYMHEQFGCREACIQAYLTVHVWRQQVGGINVSHAVWVFQQEVTLVQAYMHVKFEALRGL